MNKKFSVSRRDFVKLGGLAAGGAVGAFVGYAGLSPKSASAVQREVPAPVMGHIVCDTDLCAGCRTCEAVCSLYHEGMVSPELSRIQVSTDELAGYVSISNPCMQCDGPECLFACPTGALHVDEKTGARVINEEDCVGCQSCMNACIATPKRIRFNEEKNVCFKCDLCGGNPLCVKYCPTGALTFVPRKEG